MSTTAQHIDDAAISEAAYFIWLNEGCPAGKSQEHWIRAREALQSASASDAPRRARKAAAPKAAAPKRKAAKPAEAAAATAKPRARRKATA